MGNRFLMALYRASEALLDQTFMQRWGLLSCFPMRGRKTRTEKKTYSSPANPASRAKRAVMFYSRILEPVSAQT